MDRVSPNTFANDCARDGDPDGDSDGTTLVISSPNQPPEATVVQECDGDGCSSTDLSTDPDVTIGGWHWAFGDGYESTVQGKKQTLLTWVGRGRRHPDGRVQG